MSLIVVSPQRYWIPLSVLALVLALSLAMAVASGAVSVTPNEIGLWITGGGEAQTALILQTLRLPRALLAAGVGGLLALCGAATQGLFRNPLADPSLIGVGAGAAAGASLAIVALPNLPWPWLDLSLVSVAAFMGGGLAALAVYRLASQTNGPSVATMLLAGIGLTFLVGSFTSVLEFIADHQMLRRLSLWRMGGFDGAGYREVALVAIVLAAVLTVMWRRAQALDAMLLGESEARHLGVEVHQLKRILILCVAAGVGTAVALAGNIAFVGLVVPHLMRVLVGPGHRLLLPLSMLAGAVLLVLADTLARCVIAPTELPVGLVTALIGAPVFIALLRQNYQFGQP